jgi:hypothetical protein
VSQDQVRETLTPLFPANKPEIDAYVSTMTHQYEPVTSAEALRDLFQAYMLSLVPQPPVTSPVEGGQA